MRLQSLRTFTLLLACTALPLHASFANQDWSPALATEAHQDAQNFYSTPNATHSIALQATLAQIRRIIESRNTAASPVPYSEIGQYLISVIQRARVSTVDLNALTPPTRTAFTLLNILLNVSASNNPQSRTELIRLLSRFVEQSQEALDHSITVSAVETLAHHVNSFDRPALRLLARLLNSSEDSATQVYLNETITWNAYLDATMYRSQQDPRLFAEGTDPTFPADVYDIISEARLLNEAQAATQIWRRTRGPINESLRQQFELVISDLTELSSTGIQIRGLRLLREIITLHLSSEPSQQILTAAHVQSIRGMYSQLENAQAIAVHREILRMLTPENREFPVYDSHVHNTRASIQYLEAQTALSNRPLPNGLEAAYINDLLDNFPSQMSEAEKARSLNVLLAFFEAVSSRAPERLRQGGDLHASLLKFAARVNPITGPRSDLFNRATILMMDADVNYCELHMMPATPEA